MTEKQPVPEYGERRGYAPFSYRTLFTIEPINRSVLEEEKVAMRIALTAAREKLKGTPCV